MSSFVIIAFSSLPPLQKRFQFTDINIYTVSTGIDKGHKVRLPLYETRLLRRLFLLLSLSLLLTIASWLTYRHQMIILSPPPAGCVNIPALPDYLYSKSVYDAIGAINNARQLEHLPSLRLPINFYDLDPIQQQYVLVNLERTDRGLRPLQLDANLSLFAQAYSKQLRDLHFFAHTSPIGGTFEQRINSNPVIAGHYHTAAENLAGNPVAGAGPIYEYMYNDKAEACGHRYNILNPSLRLIGIGLVQDDQYGSISAQEFIEPALWNPYRPMILVSKNAEGPQISLTTHGDEYAPVLSFEAHVTNAIGTIRITWFLGNVGNFLQAGPALTLNRRRLSSGKHQLLAYAVDGTQNYGVARATFTT